MDKLISLEYVKQELLKRSFYPAIVKNVLEHAPTVDPETLRAKGQWEKIEDDFMCLTTYKCSLCREEWSFECDEDIKDLNYNYCPHCGAKMEGVDID